MYLISSHVPLNVPFSATIHTHTCVSTILPTYSPLFHSTFLFILPHFLSVSYTLERFFPSLVHVLSFIQPLTVGSFSLFLTPTRYPRSSFDRLSFFNVHVVPTLTDLRAQSFFLHSPRSLTVSYIVPSISVSVRLLSIRASFSMFHGTTLFPSISVVLGSRHVVFFFFFFFW